MKRLIGALFVALLPLAAQSIETLRWERLPLPVTLHVGEERVIFTDREMKVGVPANLKERLRVQSANGAVYLRTPMPLQNVRVQLHDLERGTLVMLDVTAIEPDGASALPPLKIVIESEAETQKTKTPNAPTPVIAREPKDLPVPILLTRHASQNLYAPLRAIETVPGISRAAMRTGLDLSTLLPALPVACRAVAAWKMGDMSVTAVLIRNTSARTIELDPLQLQGDYVAATFQHLHLGQKGGADDTTVVYLVTRGRGLADSLLPISVGGTAREK
ncbi:MAG: TIGR03749 family integrating conjugative element protein [Betaproteobacteria bacterium]|nr:TIGR03749 family integrating conjugative element protein [Betaproteobacteria bacterium]